MRFIKIARGDGSVHTEFLSDNAGVMYYCFYCAGQNQGRITVLKTVKYDDCPDCIYGKIYE